jgi:molybdate transport system substrate-binding protein
VRPPGAGRRARARLAVAAVLLGLAPPAGAQELTLAVAISMKEAVETLGGAFAARHPGARLRYSLGASGDLQKQIEAGAPVDVFVSAAVGPVDVLERQGLLLAGSRRVFARNALVVVTPAAAAASPATLADLDAPALGRIALGNPATVPAGEYARACLRAAGLWERLGPRLILAENVRHVLEYVARGEVDAGFVYATDVAVAGRRVRVAFRPPEDLYPPIVYPAAVVASSRHPALGRAFVDLLASAEGQAVLRRLGFRPPPGRS